MARVVTSSSKALFSATMLAGRRRSAAPWGLATPGRARCVRLTLLATCPPCGLARQGETCWRPAQGRCGATPEMTARLPLGGLGHGGVHARLRCVLALREFGVQSTEVIKRDMKRLNVFGGDRLPVDSENRPCSSEALDVQRRRQLLRAPGAPGGSTGSTPSAARDSNSTGAVVRVGHRRRRLGPAAAACAMWHMARKRAPPQSRRGAPTPKRAAMASQRPARRTNTGTDADAATNVAASPTAPTTPQDCYNYCVYSWPPSCYWPHATGRALFAGRLLLTAY